MMSSENPLQEDMPAEGGVWIFILGDMIVFSLLFCLYIYYRSQNIELFSTTQQALNQSFGAINTVLLLCSSGFLALAVKFAKENNNTLCKKFLLFAFYCGLGFLSVKAFEWGDKFLSGITVNTNEFYMFYFVLTGLHLLHVAIGMCVLVYLIKQSEYGFSEENERRDLEGGSAYWHMVDLLWIVLFPLFYLI